MVDQAWYETGGGLLSAVTMMTLEPLVEFTLRAFQPLVTFNQKIRAKFVSSSRKRWL